MSVKDTLMRMLEIFKTEGSNCISLSLLKHIDINNETYINVKIVLTLPPILGWGGTATKQNIFRIEGPNWEPSQMLFAQALSNSHSH